MPELMDRSDYVKKIFELGEALRQAHPDPTEHPPIPWAVLNLTMAQLRTLFLIVRQEKATSRELATALGVTPANITGIVNRLVRHGLVSRKRNPRDRRVLLLRATEKGRGLVEEMQTSMQEKMMSQLPKILEVMSLEDISALVQALSGFVAAVVANETGEEGTERI